jgi:hypothetical protein
METVPDFISTIKKIISKEPENWALPKSLFNNFYNENILNDNDGWSTSAIEKILSTLEGLTRTKGEHLTDTLLMQFEKQTDERKVIEKLISIVKFCDRHAYKQDHKMPFVATTLLRQDIFYKNILTWKLEDKKGSLIDDLLKSNALVVIIKNIFLFLSEPTEFITMVGLRHRRLFINKFISPDYSLHNYEPIEKLCIESNQIILRHFKELIEKENDPELSHLISNNNLEKHFLTRVVSRAVYDEDVKILWDQKEKIVPGVRYWQIAPAEQARLWDDFLEHSIIAVGFSKTEDLSGLTEDGLMKELKDKFPDFGDHKLKLSHRQLWNFINLKPGDKFVTNKGQSLLLGLGEVKGTYKFRPERQEYKHAIDVKYYKVMKEGIPIPNSFKGKFGKTIIPLKQKDFEEIENLFNTPVPRSWIFQSNPEY